ncbi:major facilitator superfamily domain-containing protein [Corynascus novoguineensis]|uniref:Major facilitator superfamily domain-containing protein n=1 Tax=Corynascus novoguineensis TaxID=1126955 RepID=A0AAN7CJL5_9PEZI|nr:major facilitator superfamily domain-containing protein [Corynascus novoguineensis]
MAEKAIESDSSSGSNTHSNSTDGDSTKRRPSPSSSPPARPYSIFSPRMRTYLTYLLGVTITLSTLTATIYFPLIPLLATHVPGGTVQSINLTVTAYAVAQALAPALFASLADHCSAGRRPVLLALVTLYAAASLGLALAGHRSYPALLALRVLQSIGGSPTPAIAYGVAADVAPVAERGAMLGPLLATCNALSAVGPVIGGAVAHRTEGVQGVFWGLMGLAGAVLVAIGFTMPETGRAVVGNGEIPARGLWRTWWDVGEGLLKRKTKKDGQSMSRRQKPWAIRDAVASFRIIFHRDAFAVLWMVASSYSIYYTFQVAIPVIFDEVYGYNELEIGLVFLPGLAGMTLGGMAAGKLVDWNYAVTAKRHGLDPGDKGKQSLDGFPIEAARYRFCLAFILVEALLVVGYGWAVWFRVHPSVPVILQFFACALSTFLSHTSSTLLVDIFPNFSSSAYASGQLMRCGLSAASAAVLQPLVDAVGRGWYFTIFSLFVSLTCAGSVVVSLWKGMCWRQKRSKQIASG